ncbi:polyprenyl synthetase family protein [Suilimivivens sp.]|uniref:polyprenyl synthetase family protein n=1 Tax=Suilimivivens sp. TaxID=2981669 RepID=UPI00307C1DDB
MNFNEQLQQKAADAEDILKRYLPEEEGYQKKVIEAMNYSVLAGGKRLRPVLMKESFLLFGGQGEVIEPFMAALEMIHNYSLVHDDLPAMDNDEYRRGRKTTWTVYGEGMAVLAGDGLLNYAYETAAKAFDKADDLEEMKRVARALQILAEKAGIYGMIGGQNGDLEAEEGKLPLTEELLLFIHEKKTAALIQAALMIGGILAGASDTEIRSLEKAAYDIGIAFQIQDDILDVTGNEKILGKPIGSDEKNHKLTYVSLNGLEKSKEDVKRLSGEAEEILSSFQEKNPFLISLIDSLITRQK